MKKTRLIFASTKDSDMRYAVKTPITSAVFYLEIGKKKLVFLDKRDFGIFQDPSLTLPLLRGGKRNPPSLLEGRCPALREGRGGGVGAKRRLSLRTIPLEPLAEEAKKLKFRTSGRNKLALFILKKYRLVGKKIEVPIHFPLDMADFLRKYGAKLTPTFLFFPERAVKTKEEIGYIQESLTHTKSSFRIIENILRRSKIKKNRIYHKNKILTSESLKQEAEYALIEKGMFDILGMIISTGKQTAIPHHAGSGPILPHQPIVCDIFPRHRASGYFSDMTRTYVKGKPSLEIIRMYNTVFKIQNTAIKKIKAGTPAREIYDAASEIIYKSGYDVGEVGLVHGLGHGVGLDIHEKPSLKADSKDILEAGNVITIEPGLYYPKLGGIRIEDMILVTKTGCQNLTNYPKRLVIT